jgi:hypothetical protein
MSNKTLLNYYSGGCSSTTTAGHDEIRRQQKMARVKFCCSDIISDPGMSKPINCLVKL